MRLGKYGWPVAAGIIAALLNASAYAHHAQTAALLTQLNPQDVLTDAKLTPALAKILADAATAYNARDYDAARADIATARALPHLTPYDTFQIDNLTLDVSAAEKDYGASAAAAEAMAASPALDDRNRKAVYDNAFAFHVAQKDYWRAIQYGELLRREQLLDAKYVPLVPQVYLIFGAYADAERVASEELAAESDPKTQKKLQKVVGLSEIKEGKAVATPGFGEALGRALLGGIASGLTGQQVDTSGPNPQASAQQAAIDAQAAIGQAQQQAASAVLAASVPSERAVYADLIAQSAQASKTDKAKARTAFNAAYRAWQKQEYAAAETGFAQGLVLDPANAEANYYYADCVARRDGSTLIVIDYLARAVAFGNGKERDARDALQQYVSPPAEGQ